jgi:hypothetical protein
MKRPQLVWLALLAALGATVAYLAARNPQPPILPADLDHEAFISAEACHTCHGPDGDLPKGTNHPLGSDCLRCHGFP